MMRPKEAAAMVQVGGEWKRRGGPTKFSPPGGAGSAGRIAAARSSRQVHAGGPKRAAARAVEPQYRGDPKLAPPHPRPSIAGNPVTGEGYEGGAQRRAAAWSDLQEAWGEQQADGRRARQEKDLRDRAAAEGLVIRQHKQMCQDWAAREQRQERINRDLVGAWRNQAGSRQMKEELLDLEDACHAAYQRFPDEGSAAYRAAQQRACSSHITLGVAAKSTSQRPLPPSQQQKPGGEEGLNGTKYPAFRPRSAMAAVSTSPWAAAARNAGSAIAGGEFKIVKVARPTQDVEWPGGTPWIQAPAERPYIARKGAAGTVKRIPIPEPHEWPGWWDVEAVEAEPAKEARGGGGARREPAKEARGGGEARKEPALKASCWGGGEAAALAETRMARKVTFSRGAMRAAALRSDEQEAGAAVGSGGPLRDKAAAAERPWLRSQVRIHGGAAEDRGAAPLVNGDGPSNPALMKPRSTHYGRIDGCQQQQGGGDAKAFGRPTEGIADHRDQRGARMGALADARSKFGWAEEGGGAAGDDRDRQQRRQLSSPEEDARRRAALVEISHPMKPFEPFDAFQRRRGRYAHLEHVMSSRARAVAMEGRAERVVKVPKGAREAAAKVSTKWDGGKDDPTARPFRHVAREKAAAREAEARAQAETDALWAAMADR